MCSFKKCKIVEMPSKKYGVLIKGKYSLRMANGANACSPYEQYVNLGIFVKTDKIEVDDLIYICDRIVKANSIHVSIGTSRWKLVASTNRDLNLPRPSSGFISKYQEVLGISEALVEYTEEDELLVKNKEITIRPLKISWSKEDLVKTLKSYSEHKGIEFNANDLQWLEEEMS